MSVRKEGGNLGFNLFMVRTYFGNFSYMINMINSSDPYSISQNQLYQYFFSGAHTVMWVQHWLQGKSFTYGLTSCISSSP